VGWTVLARRLGAVLVALAAVVVGVATTDSAAERPSRVPIVDAPARAVRPLAPERGTELDLDDLILASYEQQRMTEEAAAYVAALAAAQAAEEYRNRIPTDWALWEAVHDCEQPPGTGGPAGPWYANGGNAADPAGQTFQGGLGMSTVAWQMAVAAARARGVELPLSALAATPEQQMIGAQAFYDAHGDGWGCL